MVRMVIRPKMKEIKTVNKQMRLTTPREVRLKEVIPKEVIPGKQKKTKQMIQVVGRPRVTQVEIQVAI